jgi:hypothetical protein
LFSAGCEADAIAFTSDACQLFDGARGAASTVAPDGSYSHGPSDISAPECIKAALEQCLVLQPLQRRLRVVHNLQRMGAERQWRLESVEVHQERYESPHHGKIELLGCGGGMKGFATGACLAADALQGSWTASGVRYSIDASSTSSGSGGLAAAVVEGEAWSAAGLQGLLLHPLQAWSCCSVEGDDVSVAAGVLLEEGGASMAVVTRRLVAGRLVAAELLTLTRA